MKVKNYELDVNFEDELQPYLNSFYKYNFKGDKFIATSPFRDEKHPSFAINLENGTYIDSGCTDDEWQKGNFIKILSFLRDESYFDTEEYLIEKYRLILDDVEALTLNFDLGTKENKTIFPMEALKPFAYKCDYLDNRGISQQVKKAFRCGFDPVSKSVVFPVFDKKGNIVTFKYRKVQDKIFWYDKAGQPVKQHLYGMNFIHKMNCKTAYIVEGEIDALYLWSNKIPAIATFGASLSKRQKQLIVSSPIETLVIATDNDAVGRKFAGDLENMFLGYLNVVSLNIPNQYKDVNDIPLQKAVAMLSDLTPSTINFR